MFRLPSALRHAVGIGLTYAIIGSLWIISSDRLVEALAPDRAWLTWAQTFKGWIFVALSAALIVALVHRAVGREHAAQAALRRSLGESEVLLGEIHHRVRNNLQMVVTLLSLEAAKGEQQAVFDDTIARIQAMGLIHEHLYQRDDLGSIQLADYVRDLCEALSAALGSRHVRLDYRVAEGRCGMETAMPLAMVLVELVTNAFKHAFPADRRGTLSISVSDKDGILSLCVCDDGIGMPESLRDGTGFRLVRVIAKGGLEISPRDGGGTCVRVRLPG